MSVTEALQVRGLASIVDAYIELQNSRPGILASDCGGELAWLKQARERSVERWQTVGLPNRRLERWRYTSFAALESAKFVLPASSATPHLLPAEQFAAEIVLLNGVFAPSHSRISNVPGVEIKLLSEVFADCEKHGWSETSRARYKSFREHLETSDCEKESSFAAMNTSFLRDAVLVSVAPGVVCETPILVRHVAEGKLADGVSLLSPRVFLHIGRAGSLAFVEEFLGHGEYFANSVVDIRLEEGARLSSAFIQAEGAAATHVSTTRVHQLGNSVCESFQFDFGAKLARHDLHLTLDGQGAEAVLDGFYLATGSGHVDNYTLIEHAAAHTSSAQLYKGIVDDSGRAVFNGHVRIRRDAQKSSAVQTNNNLLLSRKAEVDTRPELEIDADDVKAAHGATVGQIDPEHIFYLQARGIDRAEAIRILSRGFAHDVVFQIKNPIIRSYMKTELERRFVALNLGGENG